MPTYIISKPYSQIAGVLFWIAALIYLPWLSLNLNHAAWWLSYPFFAAHLFTFVMVSLSIINHWRASYRTQRPQLPQLVPPVAVVVPTYSEPVAVISETVRTLLHLNYPGEIQIIISNDDQKPEQQQALLSMYYQLIAYRDSLVKTGEATPKGLYLRHSTPHKQAKAGNLNQAVQYIKQYFPHIDLILTQDADEIVFPDLLIATIGYFTQPEVAYVQTIKQSQVHPDDPFGNQDYMFYCRTAPSRDASNAMFACGSGVIWRISALDSIGGFNTWNLVEDLTTSYELLSQGWHSRYHYEALSSGLAPEDLPNFIKQRGTWALDTMRLFFWDNPLFKPGLTLPQRLQFLEIPLFYLNGLVTVLLILLTAASLLTATWPTSRDAITHAVFSIPFFLTLEIYFLSLAQHIPLHRIRQFWIGLSPVFAWATIQALINGPHKKPSYKVTRKQNLYGNYLSLVWPQLVLIGFLNITLIKTLIATPIYSTFDWGAFFWGVYLSSYFIQIIKVSWWNWSPEINYQVVVPNLSPSHIISRVRQFNPFKPQFSLNQILNQSIEIELSDQ